MIAQLLAKEKLYRQQRSPSTNDQLLRQVYQVLPARAFTMILRLSFLNFSEKLTMGVENRIFL
jgi:hypothetical protein